jgi:2-methylfumaryl-CoA isomerase
MNELLSGVAFVERSAFVAAPLAGKTLAQLGACVLKVDDVRGGPDWTRWPLGADGRSLYWAELNRGKKSMLVDTRSGAGRELVAELASVAGGFLTNLDSRPPVSVNELRARRPDLIYALIEGNRGGRTAIDYTVNAALGHASIVGPADHVGPINHQLPAWDISTGLLTAASVAAAVHRRGRGDGGALIHTSLLDVALALTGSLGWLAEAQLNHRPRARVGNAIFGAFGHDFTTLDGHQVMVAAVSERQWRALVAATSAESLMALLAERGCELDTESGRFRATAAIAGVLSPWFGSRNLAEVSDALDRHGVCWDAYQELPDFMASDARASTSNPVVWPDPDAAYGEAEDPSGRRGDDWEHPAEAPKVVSFPVTLDGDASRPGHVPGRGEHTEEVLLSLLGLSTAEIGRLHRDGTVGLQDDVPGRASPATLGS